ncbi:hypothetical protein CerSpe_173750 [Prunus speciosa]
MATLSGGEGFLYGILENTSLAYCLSSIAPGIDLVPPIFKTTAYSHIAIGKNHVCAIRGSYYYDHEFGTVDCWEIFETWNKSLSSKQSTLFSDQSISNLVFKKVVSSEGFSCGGVRDGGLICWGPNSSNLGVLGPVDNFTVLALGRASLCGIPNFGELKFWGDIDLLAGHPNGTQYVSLAAGEHHFCGIREENHGIEYLAPSSPNFPFSPKYPIF